MRTSTPVLRWDGRQISESENVASQEGSDRAASALYTWLLRRHGWRREPGWRRSLWEAAFQWGLSRYGQCTVAINVHGRRTLCNFGHSYPLYARTYSGWNGPLIELVARAHADSGRPVNIIDVGAGIGDTVMLLKANCAEAVGDCLCIDGDREFAGYLASNLASMNDVCIANVMLASDASEVRSLVRLHAGTASAKGDGHVDALTLDMLVDRFDGRRFDVLKIDVDGYDGKVLAGARKLLSSARPAVIFEWHPNACADAGNSWTEHFSVLLAAGYDRFSWYTKFGQFSHFGAFNDGDLSALAELARRKHHDADWHYDVIALHAESRLSVVELAELHFAKLRRSWY